jgi:hypothetical protein
LAAGCGGEKSAPVHPAQTATSVPSAAVETREPSARDKVAAVLGIRDEQVVGRVYDLLQYVAWTMHGVHMPATREEAVQQRVDEFYRPDKKSDDLLRALERKIEPTLTDRIFNDWRDALVEAQRAVQKARPDLLPYDAKAVVHKALNTAWTSYRSITFPPDPRLTRPLAVPPVPPASPDYAWLDELAEAYFHDARYEKLAALPADQLPDGALAYLLRLDAFGITGILRGDDYGVPARDVLANYGDRLYPVLVDAMAEPEKYGLKFESYPAMYRVEYAKNFSEEHRQALLRAALLSGWNDTAKYFEEDWVVSLCEEFKDSPHGAPRM